MKEKAIIEECEGEAHSNPHIDHCGVCMPYWKEYPICPTHKDKISQKGYCKKCNKYYDIGRLACKSLI